MNHPTRSKDSESNSSEPIVHSLLLEEYKTIQGKIDKIGEDKFKIRSWSFTLLTGGVAAAKFTGALENSVLGPFLVLLFIPAVWAFQLVEKQQRQFGKRLGLRAATIENEWRRFFRIKAEVDFRTPQLANELIREGRKERRPKGFWSFLSKPFKPAYADEVFYLAQYLLIFLSFVALFVDRRFRADPTPNSNALVFRYGTNEFRLVAGQTNNLVTNYIEVVRYTTNFIVVERATTNFVVHDVTTTNAVTKGGIK